MVNTYLYRIETVISLCRTSASQTSSTICGLALALMVIVMMTNPNQTFAWMKMAMIMMIMTIQNLPVGRPYVLSSPLLVIMMIMMMTISNLSMAWP